MAIGLTPNELLEYVLKEDRELPEAEQTVFLLRSLSMKERAQLQDKQGTYSPKRDEVSVNLGSNNLLAVQAALDGWRNYRDSKGEEIPFEKETSKQCPLGSPIFQPTEATLGRLPQSHLDELAKAIREGTRLSRDDVKN